MLAGMPGSFTGEEAPPSGEASSGFSIEEVDYINPSRAVALFHRKTFERPKYSKFRGSFKFKLLQ